MRPVAAQSLAIQLVTGDYLIVWPAEPNVLAAAELDHHKERRVGVAGRNDRDAGAVPWVGLGSPADNEGARSVADQLGPLRPSIPSRDSLHDLRVLVTARGGQDPLGFQLVIPGNLQRHHRPAQTAGRLAHTLARGAEPFLQFPGHSRTMPVVAPSRLAVARTASGLFPAGQLS